MIRGLALLIAGALTVSAADRLADSAQRKLEAIETRQLKPGSVVSFSPEEINAWARAEVPKVVPEGMRDEQVELFDGTATGYALVDFLKMRQGKGESTSWLMSRLIEGERPLKVWVRVESAGGRCTVYLTQVELSNVAITQSVLDFLIKTFFVPLYPDAKINQPFDLDYNIDRIEFTPRAIVVTIRR